MQALPGYLQIFHDQLQGLEDINCQNNLKKTTNAIVISKLNFEIASAQHLFSAQSEKMKSLSQCPRYKLETIQSTNRQDVHGIRIK